MKNKVILTDCDGVILDWVYAFDQWMARHDYRVVEHGQYQMELKYGLERKEAKRLVRMFNESATIRKLPPLRDAIKYIRKLHEEHGYIFHAITSLSKDQYACHLRTKNLRELFGDTAFEKYVYLDTGADKDNELVKYQDTGCWWIEDKPENAECGLKFGLNSLLVDHDFNQNYTGHIPRVKNWKQIYNIITGDNNG